MIDMERKSLAFEVKAAGDSGEFAVYAAVFGNVDRAGEIIAPGAFSNLDTFVSEGWGCTNHDWASLPDALIDSATQDSKGLLIKGRFHSYQKAQDCRTWVRERMAAGKAVKCSIGYRVLDSAQELMAGKPVRILKAIELYEFSFVNLPANPQAQALAAKGFDPAPLIAEAKAGRVLSRSNYSRLKKWCEDTLATAADLRGWLDQHDPDRPGDAGEEPAVEPDAKGDRSGWERLRHRALRSRLSLYRGFEHDR